MSIRFACPHCQVVINVAVNRAGTKTVCPKCNMPMQVPIPHGKILAQRQVAVEVNSADIISNTSAAPVATAAQFDFSSQARDDYGSTRQRYQPKKYRRTGLWCGLAITAVLFAVYCAGRAGSKSNAKCPICGEEFSVSERYRGNISQHMREYRCPRCGVSWPVSVLYKSMDDEPPKK